MKNNCEGLKGRLLDLCLCRGHDGRPDPTPVQCAQYRQHFRSMTSENWSPSLPSRGVGDLVAKITSNLGIKPCGGCKGRQNLLNKVLPFKYNAGDTPPFITSQKLMEDTKRLAAMLPHNTAGIIGIARSGLCVATMLSMLIHRPLTIFRQSYGDLVPAGNGWRLTGNASDQNGVYVVVDDTVMTGNSFKYSMPIILERHPSAISVAVYVNPAAKVKPDLWVQDLPWPHLLEWNMFNSIMSPSMAVDFDGILCEDCSPEQDDDGEKYLNFLEQTRPKYYARKTAIPLIVTARLEKYRPQTLEWLSRHGISVDKLVMGPWDKLSDRTVGKVIQLKAEEFSKFSRELSKRRSIKPAVFVESDIHQSKAIANLARGIVVCPAAGRCFP